MQGEEDEVLGVMACKLLLRYWETGESARALLAKNRAVAIFIKWIGEVLDAPASHDITRPNVAGKNSAEV